MENKNGHRLDAENRDRQDKPDGFMCELCGGPTHEDQVQSAIWGKKGLVLVEDIPARVCERCGEQHLDEISAAKVNELTAYGFPSHKAVREIVVPVFSLNSVSFPNEEEIKQMDRYEAVKRQEQMYLNED